jgi:hypothetical protein
MKRRKQIEKTRETESNHNTEHETLNTE